MVVMVVMVVMVTSQADPDQTKLNHNCCTRNDYCIEQYYRIISYHIMSRSLYNDMRSRGIEPFFQKFGITVTLLGQGHVGFEPTTCSSANCCANRCANAPKSNHYKKKHSDYGRS